MSRYLEPLKSLLRRCLGVQIPPQQVFGYIGYLYVPTHINYVCNSFRHHWFFTKKKWDNAEVPRTCPSSCQRLSDSPAFLVVFWWCFGWSTEKQNGFVVSGGLFATKCGVYIRIKQTWWFHVSLLIWPMEDPEGHSFWHSNVWSDFMCETGYSGVW